MEIVPELEKGVLSEKIEEGKEKASSPSEIGLQNIRSLFFTLNGFPLLVVS